MAIEEGLCCDSVLSLNFSFSASKNILPLRTKSTSKLTALIKLDFPAPLAPYIAPSLKKEISLQVLL